jgi:hypothetical protein
MDQGASFVYAEPVHPGNASALHASGVLSSFSLLPLTKGHGGQVGPDNRRNNKRKTTAEYFLFADARGSCCQGWCPLRRDRLLPL